MCDRNPVTRRSAAEELNDEKVGLDTSASLLPAETPTSPIQHTSLQAADLRAGKIDLTSLCAKWVQDPSSDNGKRILDSLQNEMPHSDDAANAMKLLLDYSGDCDMADQITGKLLKYAGAAKQLAITFSDRPTVVFNQIFERGNDSTDSLTTLLLDQTHWPSEATRVVSERDAFQLAMAQMMMAGQDHPDRAMKTIARLLGTDSPNLKGLIDADVFDVILSQLDIRAPPSLRAYATVATSRLLHLSPDISHQLISQYVIKRVEHPTIDALILAFSAASAVFPMAPEPAARLFVSGKFINNFVALITQWRSSRLEHVALELLNAACQVKSCREAIRTICLDWLVTVVRGCGDAKKASQAGVILVKLLQDQNLAIAPGKAERNSSLNDELQTELVLEFRNLILSTNNEENSKNDAVEGLAYASIDPEVKESLSKDNKFVTALIRLLDNQGTEYKSLYGGLTIIENITKYAPVLTEEQKRLLQLRSYTNAGKTKPSTALESDDAVNRRCTRLLRAAVIPMLLSHTSNNSPNVRLTVTNVLANLTREKSHRALMAQQGVVKALLQLYDREGNTVRTGEATKSVSASQRTAAHGLARILISVNPNHVFGSSGVPSVAVVRPLVTLLQPSLEAEGANLLPVFEALLALTNLADIEDAAEAIVRLAWSHIEDLLLSSNVMVRRATVELACNLCSSPYGVAKFADESKQARNNLQLMLALTDVDDLATRRAAGGALAMLTGWDAAIPAILAMEKGIPMLITLCSDESEECQHRGIVAVRNLIFAPDELAVKAKTAVLSVEGATTLQQVAATAKTQEITDYVQEVLQALK